MKCTETEPGFHITRTEQGDFENERSHCTVQSDLDLSYLSPSSFYFAFGSNGVINTKSRQQTCSWLFQSEIVKCVIIIKIKGLKVLKVALMVRPWYFGNDRWSSPLYMTILLLCNWDSFGKQSWEKEKLIFFTQDFPPIWLKFNGSSHIWLVFSNLTSLQFSWANAVTCNWQLPTRLDLFIFRVDI